MKKAVFFILLLFSLGVYAQDEQPRGRNFEKGTYILGLNGSGSYGNGALSKSSAVSFTPWVGFFPLQNMAAGVRLSYGRDILEIKDSSVPFPAHKISSVAPEVFIRYYVPKIKVKPFAQVGVGYNFQQEAGRKVSDAIGSVEGGLSFPLGRRLGLEVSYNWRAFGTSTLMDANNKTNLRLGIIFKL